ncbi:hypothetical protein F8M41_005853 [Gigaspora margarita]|uniref:Uncharacterized protein n=1 Tax=Gigaspora margarita TaxID=4874 RepID=A0A8H4A498_GIGMA|nr:hypothetical protein F8M41_005853 [Gigaspora margarita]
MWLERSSLNEEQNFDQAHPKKKVLAKQNESIILQSIFPSYDEIQKSFQAMFDKRDAEQKADIAKRDASHKAEIKKLKTEFKSKMSQQSKKSRPPVPPKDHEQIHEFYADQGDPRWSNLSREEALQWLNKAFPPPIASKPKRLRSSNQNARIDRIESKVDEISQMTSQFGRMMLDNKKPVAKSNSTHRYFLPLIPSQSQYASPDKDNEGGYDEGGYNEEENRWHAPFQSEKKNRPKGVLLCNKSNHSYKAQEEINEWFLSIQYLHSNINDLAISNSFLDSGSEFGAVNDATIEALEWENDKQSDFAIKSDNSKHITKSLGWIIDVPVSIKDKGGKQLQFQGILHVLIIVNQNQCYV